MGDCQTAIVGFGEPEVPHLAVNIGGSLRVADHPYLLGKGMVRQKVHDSPQGHCGSLVDGVSVHTGGDGGKIHAADAVLGCQRQT